MRTLYGGTRIIKKVAPAAPDAVGTILGSVVRQWFSLVLTVGELLVSLDIAERFGSSLRAIVSTVSLTVTTPRLVTVPASTLLGTNRSFVPSPAVVARLPSIYVFLVGVTLSSNVAST